MAPTSRRDKRSRQGPERDSSHDQDICVFRKVNPPTREGRPPLRRNCLKGVSPVFGNEPCQCFRRQKNHAAALELQPFLALPVT
jgi:hypothetical protein